MCTQLLFHTYSIVRTINNFLTIYDLNSCEDWILYFEIT